jgi:hypothetical protein
VSDVVPERWMPLVQTENGRINRIAYEICALQALRDKLRCKEIWVEGALRYRNPEDDLPKDFDARREEYYQALNQPLDADAFIAKIQNDMRFWLDTLDRGLPKNDAARISKQRVLPALLPAAQQVGVVARRLFRNDHPACVSFVMAESVIC